jgi:SAM-dependent methyltransferase
VNPGGVVPDTCFANWPRSRDRLATWYETPLGRELAFATMVRAADLLDGLHGEHALQIGGARHASDLLGAASAGHHLYIRGQVGDSLSAEPEALPLASGSIHLLVLWHVLEYRDDPVAVLSEAERVLAPEGHLLLVTFNPWSLFGLRRVLPHDGVPWSGHFPGRLRLHFRLRRAGLGVEATAGCWRRPPAHGARLRHWLGWLERGHRVLDYLGGIQLIRARKRQTFPTPIALGSNWRQRLPTGHPASPRFGSGVSARGRSQPVQPMHSTRKLSGERKHRCPTS